MADRQIVIVRRVQARDAERVASFVNRALRGRVEIDPQAVTRRSGGVGFFLAEMGNKPVGLIGWRVENLVARLTDLLIWPSSRRAEVAPPLFEEMESAAMDLQAEAALLFPPSSGRDELVRFCETLGYELRVVGDLPRPWQQTAREAGRDDDDAVLVKELRSERVFRPL